MVGGDRWCAFKSRSQTVIDRDLPLPTYYAQLCLSTQQAPNIEDPSFCARKNLNDTQTSCIVFDMVMSPAS